MTTLNGDTRTPPLTTATSLIEEGPLRDEQTNEVNLPLTSTVVLNRKQELLYVPLDFENNFTVDALVDSEALVSAIAQDDLDTIKQKALKQHSQNRRPAQFSNTSSHWPDRETVINSHTKS